MGGRVLGYLEFVERFTSNVVEFPVCETITLYTAVAKVGLVIAPVMQAYR